MRTQRDLQEGLIEAVAEALTQCRHWVGGAGVYRDDDGTLVAHSPLTARALGLEEVIRPITDPSDLLGPYAPSQLTSKRALQYARLWVNEFGDLTELINE